MRPRLADGHGGARTPDKRPDASRGGPPDTRPRPIGAEAGGDLSGVAGGTLIILDTTPGSARSLTLDGVAPGSLAAANFHFV
jgi:hypothetical protein